MRFVASRGSMSVGASQGGLPPDGLVETDATILRDTQRLIETYHDRSHGAMVNVAVAPCSPFSVSRDLMRESAALARSLGVRRTPTWPRTITTSPTAASTRLHADRLRRAARLARRRCLARPLRQARRRRHRPVRGQRHGCRPLPVQQHAARFRHRADPPHARRRRAGRTRRRRSASNDGAHMVGEARQALLLARVDARSSRSAGDHGPAEMSARDVLALATRGGARVLGRSHDIGQLAPGRCADLALFDLRSLGFAGGAVHDPLGSLVLVRQPAGRLDDRRWPCRRARGPRRQRRHGPLIERHNQLAIELARGARRH